MKSLLAGMLVLLLAWVPGAAAATQPQEGTDYVRIEAAPWAPRPGRIEVPEVFAYTCPHCAHFEPMLREWKRRPGKGVDLVPVPPARNGPTDAWPRAECALLELGPSGR